MRVSTVTCGTRDWHGMGKKRECVKSTLIYIYIHIYTYIHLPLCYTGPFHNGTAASGTHQWIFRPQMRISGTWP